MDCVHGYTDCTKTDNGTNDGVSGGNWPALDGCDQQPGSGCEQSGQHAEDHLVRADQVSIKDAAANSLGNRAAGQISAKKLEYHGDHNRLFDG